MYVPNRVRGDAQETQRVTSNSFTTALDAFVLIDKGPEFKNPKLMLRMFVSSFRALASQRSSSQLQPLRRCLEVAHKLLVIGNRAFDVPHTQQERYKLPW